MIPRAHASEFGCIFGEFDAPAPGLEELEDGICGPSDFGVDPWTVCAVGVSAVVGATALAHNVLAIHHFMKESSSNGGLKG